MWRYEQVTGRMLDSAGELVAVGYAGKGVGKNNPALQDQHNLGPLPQGMYSILAPVDTRTHGPYVLWLLPAAMNEMFGRSGFGIHGDSVVEPGTASDGCIILPHAARVQIGESGDRALEVVAGVPVTDQELGL
jgi:hypothetical protein